MKLKRIYTEIANAVYKVREKTDKSIILLLADIVYCGIAYGASPENYYKFEFYKLPHNKRKTFVTNRVSRNIIKKYH